MRVGQTIPTIVQRPGPGLDGQRGPSWSLPTCIRTFQYSNTDWRVWSSFSPNTPCGSCLSAWQRVQSPCLCLQHYNSASFVCEHASLGVEDPMALLQVEHTLLDAKIRNKSAMHLRMNTTITDGNFNIEF